MRSLSRLDRVFAEVQHGLESVFAKPKATRDNPAALRVDDPLESHEIRKSQGYMRVNHTGEICAQALYRGQAHVTDNVALKAYLYAAAKEEIDHLAWCHERLDELGTHRSRLNFLWYTTSFLLGFIMARKSDAWSLGFVKETEKQVVQHLARHAQKLSPDDHKSRSIVAVMLEDEHKHGEAAHAQGAQNLPELIKMLMQLQSKVMTSTAYFV